MFKGICPSCHFSKLVPENMNCKRVRCGRCDFVFYMTRLRDSEPDFTIVPEPKSRPRQGKEPDMKDLDIKERQPLRQHTLGFADEIDWRRGGYLRSFEANDLKKEIENKKKKKPLLSDNMKLGLIIGGILVLGLFWMCKGVSKEPTGRRR